MAGMIEMPFALRIWVDPWNHVVDGVQMARAMAQFIGERT